MGLIYKIKNPILHELSYRVGTSKFIHPWFKDIVHDFCKFLLWMDMGIYKENSGRLTIKTDEQWNLGNVEYFRWLSIRIWRFYVRITLKYKKSWSYKQIW